MAFLGSIIKGLINFRDVVVPEKNPVEAQQEVLRHLLGKAKNTAFGKHYNFEAILNAENPEKTFAERIPFFNYNKINDEWWYRLHEGEENITWPGSPPYFALSSGTTGAASKRIPVTKEMLEAIQNTGIKQVGSLVNYDLPADFFEREIMMLGSSTQLEHVGNHKEGEISGISADNIPFWFRGFYKPGSEIAKIEDWDERVLQIARNAKNWDIGAISGIPAWTEIMLQKIIDYNNLENIHEIWPNFKIYTSGGVAFESYEKSFNELLGKPIIIIDTYLASEGFLAFQSRPGTMAMKLVLDEGVYFEFVPLHPDIINEDGSIKQNSTLVPLSEVREEEEYVLVISTVSGLWRYVIGDTIKFTDVERKEIKITGRTKFFLNVSGEQLSVNQLNEAVKQLEERFDLTIPEFTLSAIKKDDGFVHKWYLGITESKVSEEALAQALDEILGEIRSYRSARDKVLTGVEVLQVHPDIFYEWNAKNKKKGGQVKMEKVMKEEKFKAWEEFVANN